MKCDAVLDPASAALPEQVLELTGDGLGVVFEASGAPRALRQAFDFMICASNGIEV